MLRARAPDLHEPTSVVFDLDPGPPAGLLECGAVALHLKGLFDAWDLESFAKVSGSKGLHISIPLNTAATYEMTQPFARAIAELAAQQIPKQVGALSGVLHFVLIREAVGATWSGFHNGLLPALFVLPYAFGVLHLIKRRGVVPASGDAHLAGWGGVAFLQPDLPVQFDREWITAGCGRSCQTLDLSIANPPNTARLAAIGAIWTNRLARASSHRSGSHNFIPAATKRLR